jgi:hypothetical protein
MARTKIFVSYSHKDRDWLHRFLQHTAVLERSGLVDIWSDQRIETGAAWEQEIETALTTAKVAVLLVSPAFLAAEYVWKDEIPRIVKHAAKGMDIWPLIVRPCAWRLEGALSRLQARPVEGRSLSVGNDSQVDLDLSAFVYELAAKIGKFPLATTPSDTFSRQDSAGAISHQADPSGEWAGYYNQTRPLRLVIAHEINAEAFDGRMEYPGEGTITTIKGTVYKEWSSRDVIWTQIDATRGGDYRLAVSFRETGYQNKGSTSISFDGEYRAIISGKMMTGAWFSGSRLVGTIMLEHI